MSCWRTCCTRERNARNTNDREVAMLTSRTRTTLLITALVLTISVTMTARNQDQTDTKKTEKADKKAAKTSPRFAKLKVEVKSGDQAVEGALVSLKQDAGFRYESTTNKNGGARFA